MAKEKRVVKVYSQKMGYFEIRVDRENGVNNLFYTSGYADSLAVYFR